jgi:hypothetical protein
VAGDLYTPITRSLNNLECDGANIVIDLFDTTHCVSAKVSPEVLFLVKKPGMLVAVLNGHTSLSVNIQRLHGFTLVTTCLNHPILMGVNIGSVKEGVKISNFIDFFNGESNPSPLCTAKPVHEVELAMFAAIANRHTLRSLCGVL